MKERKNPSRRGGRVDQEERDGDREGETENKVSCVDYRCVGCQCGCVVGLFVFDGSLIEKGHGRVSEEGDGMRAISPPKSI
ncbi:hypothetical protein Scep_010156 [Stephania cephalantha]|uniref:Uncharacterized protein n=1 Tax=Stephania cephalantha TaxID=152367 RepID=A0AAP0JWR6_9MAGN